MTAKEHATEIGDAIRRLELAMLHAGFKRGQFGLAIMERGAFESLCCIALSAAQYERFDEARPPSWYGVPIRTVYPDTRKETLLHEANVKAREVALLLDAVTKESQP